MQMSEKLARIRLKEKYSLLTKTEPFSDIYAWKLFYKNMHVDKTAGSKVAEKKMVEIYLAQISLTHN